MSLVPDSSDPKGLYKHMSEQEIREKRERKEKRKLEKQKRKHDTLSDRDGTEGQIASVTVPTKLKMPKLSFPINEQCTSFTLSPTGRHIIAGFQDGTLRLFDTTGRLWRQSHRSDESESLFDCNSDEDETVYSSDSAKNSNRRMVASRTHQTYGAVACQIHAKGVITSLIMHVDCCQDGKFAFGGVLRGSTELVAVDLRQLEKYHDNYADSKGELVNILDLVQVHRHSDAKLKGFGACIKLNHSRGLEYRLFTGKGIKNIHIWSFIPPNKSNEDPMWQCLYDTPTNGNTINYLKFRHDFNGLLQGISKSDDQKLRVWDLSFEEKIDNHESKKSIIKALAKKTSSELGDCKDRPKRPPYVDVASTENALCVAGPYVFSGGDSMYNKMGVMYLDVEDIQSPFNHNEFALPHAICEDDSSNDFQNKRHSRGGVGRQQRGDLKSVVNVAGMNNDAKHVLLELSDKSFVHYHQSGHQSSLFPFALDASTCMNSIISLTQVKGKNACVLSICSYNDSTNKGLIKMRYLPEKADGKSFGRSVRCGFSEPVFIPFKHPLSTASEKFIDHSPVRSKNFPEVSKKHLVPPTSTDRKLKQTRERTLLTTEDLLFKPDPNNSNNDAGSSPLLSRRLDQTSKSYSRNTNSNSSILKNIQTDSSRSSDIRTGPAVSPESSKPEESDSKLRNKVDRSKSIGRFFSDSTNIKVKKNTKSKKVQFSNPSINDETCIVSKNQKEHSFGILERPKRRVLNEFDVKNALINLKKFAGDVNYIQSITVPEAPQTHDHQQLIEFLESRQNRKRPKLMNQVQPFSISVRSGCHDLIPFYQNEGIIFNSNPNSSSLEESQYMKRKQLAMHHRAAHERLRNSIYLSGERVLNLASNPKIEIGSDSKQLFVDKLRKELDATVKGHKESLSDLLANQRLEAQSLASIQSRESGKPVPSVAVSFPFPEAFDVLEKSVLEYFAIDGKS